MDEKQTELQAVWNSIRDLQQKIWSLKLDIANLERELYATEFRKAEKSLSKDSISIPTSSSSWVITAT